MRPSNRSGIRIARAIGLWSAILVLAVLNGLLRELVLVPALGRSTAFVASGVLLMTCIFLVALAGIRACCLGSSGACAWRVGVLWLGLTLVLETALAKLRGMTWGEIWEAYTFADGNIWPIVLAFTLVAPWLAAGVARGVKGRA